MDTEDIKYLKSLPKEEAARILHARGVAQQMKLYQKSGMLGALAMLIYGSDKVFDRSVRSLGASFVTAYLAPAQEHRNTATALAHCTYPDHTDAQTAAILMVNLLPEHVAQTAANLSTSQEAVETALTLGIAELLNNGQLMNLSIMSTALFLGVTATKQLRHPRD